MQRLEYLNSTIPDIVRQDYRTADVFRKHGVNYCCGGKISLEEACSLKGIDVSLIRKDLEAATRNVYVSNQLDYENWNVDFLIDYIIHIHHGYLKKTLPGLTSAVVSFVEGHKNKYPVLAEVRDILSALSTLTDRHCLHEEEVIFPYIKQLEGILRRKDVYGNLFVRTLRKPLSNITQEHQAISELLETLRTCTENYQSPSNACTNHRVIYGRLEEFENDLLQHAYLENQFLFPKAIEMERQLLEL
jgi:regulator of cell morphogenesis and NO signaling